jgi:predicted transcriptional regulator
MHYSFGIRNYCSTALVSFTHLGERNLPRQRVRPKKVILEGSPPFLALCHQFNKKTSVASAFRHIFYRVRVNSLTHPKGGIIMEIADIDGLSLKALKKIVQSGRGSIEDLAKEPEIKEDLEQITADLADMGVIKIENGIVTITEKGVKVLEKLQELIA